MQQSSHRWDNLPTQIDEEPLLGTWRTPCCSNCRMKGYTTASVLNVKATLFP